MSCRLNRFWHHFWVHYKNNFGWSTFVFESIDGEINEYYWKRILFSYFVMVKLWMIIVSLCQFRNIKISLFSQNISYIGSMQNVDGPERQIQNNKWTMKHARCVCFHNFIYLLVLFCRKEHFRRMQYSIEKEKDCMSVDNSDIWHSKYKTIFYDICNMS